VVFGNLCLSLRAKRSNLIWLPTTEIATAVPSLGSGRLAMTVKAILVTDILGNGHVESPVFRG
jgi:hypothetical protein